MNQELSVQFEFRPYARSFLQPLKTTHGMWTVREGILVRLQDPAGRVGLGEIAPLSWFGSEEFAAAIAYCQQLPNVIDWQTIAQTPNTLPACQFGLETAWEALQNLEASNVGESNIRNLHQSVLLPHQELQAWRSWFEQGYRTFKVKIGLTAIADELLWIERLLTQLPRTAKLRLDANGGLTTVETRQWLQFCDSFKEHFRNFGQIEFLEQPLPSFSALLEFSQTYQTPIALDESVATIGQLKTYSEKGWPGIFVVKPAIVGSPAQLRKFCRSRPLDLVFSSVFETPIGRRAGLKLAVELGNPDRAVGYGTNHWFEETSEDRDTLWQSL